MIVKCDSDSTAFILHCTFTSVFCLRHECRKLKASVLMILAISDMMAALSRKFANAVFQNGMWSDFTFICKHPQMLLQIGKILFDKTNLGDTISCRLLWHCVHTHWQNFLDTERHINKV